MPHQSHAAGARYSGNTMWHWAMGNDAVEYQLAMQAEFKRLAAQLWPSVQ
jgi:membrane-bound inhibitor of C-type lysozyme